MLHSSTEHTDLECSKLSSSHFCSASIATYVKKLGGMRVGWPPGAQIYFMTNDLSDGAVKISEDELYSS